MASPVPVETVLTSLIINIHPLKQTVLFTTAYTKLGLNPKQAVYLLIPISCPGLVIGFTQRFVNCITAFCCSEIVNVCCNYDLLLIVTNGSPSTAVYCILLLP